MKKETKDFIIDLLRRELSIRKTELQKARYGDSQVILDIRRNDCLEMLDAWIDFIDSMER
jgi:hypothetical protein